MTTNVIIPSNVIQIDHKGNKTVKYHPIHIYSKKRHPWFKLKKENSNSRKVKNKHRGALSKKLHWISSKERCPQISLASLNTKINKRQGALSKNTIFLKCFSSGEANFHWLKFNTQPCLSHRPPLSERLEQARRFWSFIGSNVSRTVRIR